jgi:dihydroxy-acid dehydratase
MTRLRSASWLEGDDEVALAHRVALASAGLPIRAGTGRPVIGISNSASDLNPCNLPLGELAAAVKRGIRAAGGQPAVFPTMSLGEDLMKPSAMLYRNLVAMEIEETIRAYPLDGVVLLANCDKTIPAAVMGSVSADLPAIVVTGGARPPAWFRGKRIGSGTSLWRLWDDRRSGRLSDQDWDELERCLQCGLGACNTMGTASTMAILTEALGLMLPGASTIPAGDQRGIRQAEEAGRRIVAMVEENLRPSAILTAASFANAIRILNAIAGSTNAVIHLAAIAGRAGIPFTLDGVARLGANVPVLADVEPSGSGLIQDFATAGGLPCLLRAIAGLLDLSARTVTGGTLGDIAATAPPPSGVIRPPDSPLFPGGAIAVVKGSLAPDGALLKTTTATPGLFRHRGRAVVFHGYHHMRHRVDDPDLQVTADSVLVLAECGPVGAPGMPEWGMIPIPAKLAATGVQDMIRVTDARMSGTSFGTVFLHVAPEAAIGGPLALVRDGDWITVDVTAGRLDIEVSEAELNRRRQNWQPRHPEHLRGWPALYRDHVTQAPQGCDLDFLQAPTPAHRRFVEPVIGRS